VAAGGSPPGPGRGGVGEPTNRFTLKLGLMHTLFRVIGVLPRSGRERSTRLRLCPGDGPARSRGGVAAVGYGQAGGAGPGRRSRRSRRAKHSQTAVGV
jgi:hypothetical protein